LNGRCYRFYGKAADPGRIRLYRIAAMIGVTSAAVAVMVMFGVLINWYFGAAMFALIFGGVPVLVYLLCSHVRVESDRLVIVRDYGFFKQEEEVPRHLIEGAEVITEEISTREGTRRIGVVRVYLRDRGCMPLVVSDPEGLARELGPPPS